MLCGPIRLQEAAGPLLSIPMLVLIAVFLKSPCVRLSKICVILSHTALNRDHCFGTQSNNEKERATKNGGTDTRGTTL